ncbi:22254_t:CDS:10 [Rhizophagus irregularis]|nr:22254_t:CDS:10 [Rhizophagus irregularis]
MLKVFVTNGRADQHGIPSFINELKDDYQWVGISGKSQEDAKNELYRMYYDYIGDLDKDGYDHMIILLKKLVRYKCFALYSMETIHRIMLLIENLVTDHRGALGGISSLYEVCESLLRQIRGGDTSEVNILLSSEVLEFFQRESTWLYNNERLLHITFYTFASLIRDHSEPRFEALKTKEIKFCRFIFDNHYNSFFKIGRDLIRLLKDNLIVPEFSYVINAIPDDVKATLMKQRTLVYCLSSRLTYDMNERLTHMLEQHSISAYKRKFDFFKTNFLSTEPRYLIADIIRWVIAAYRSNNEKAMNNRYILINFLLHEIGNNWEAIELAKMALVYDWLCFDRNCKDPNVTREGLYCIEPCIQLIVDNVKSNSLRIAKDLIETLHSSINIFPGFENEIRENVRAASQDIKTIRTKLSEFAGDTRIVKIVGDLWGHLMNAPPPSSSLPYLANPSQPIVMQIPSATNIQMPHQDVNQRFPASLSLPQTPQNLVQPNPLFTPSHDKPPEVADLTGPKPGTNFQNLDNQTLPTKRRDSIPFSDQPSNVPVAQVTKSHETKSIVEETSSTTRIIVPSPSNSVPVPASLWLYSNHLKNFKVASLSSNSVDETQYLRQGVKLDAPNSPHLTDLPSFIGPDICRTLNFDELNGCFDLNSECLEINPSKQNLFNCLVSWVFDHKDEPSRNDSPKFKSFEMYRLIIKKDEKVKCEDSQPNVEEEVNKRFLTGVQLLQQYECNVFDSIVPKLLQNWPDIFVGKFEFITSIIHGINPMLVPEIGNNIEKIEEFISSSLQLKVLEPIEHPEALCGLLSLLELIPPTENNISLLTKLITNAKSQESKFENIKFVISIFTRWNDVFPDRLIKVMTSEVDNKIRKLNETEPETEDDENEASAFFDVIVELWKNEKLKQAFMSLRPNFMLLGESVEKETTFLQRPPEAADDDGEQMEAEDGDGKAKQIEIEDRSKRSTGSQNNRNAQNRQKAEATSDESSSSHEKTPEKTQSRKIIKPKRVKRKINPTSSEASDEEQTASSNKNHRQTKKRPTTSDRRKSVSSGGEEETKPNRSVRSKTKNASASTRSEPSKATSTQNINRRKSVGGPNAKKRNAKGSDEE